MVSGQGFVDLRVSHASSQGGEDSIWPSFTDIMTVIVMIFLLALVAFLINNAQLVSQLKNTISEKDAASAAALSSFNANESLRSELLKIQAHVTSLQTTLEQANRQQQTLEQSLQAKEKAVSDLRTEISLLAALRDELNRTNSELLNNVKLSDQALVDEQRTNSAQQNNLNQKISLLLAEKAKLVTSNESQRQTLSDSEKARAELNAKLISLSEQVRAVEQQLKLSESEKTALSSNFEQQNQELLGLQTDQSALQAKLTAMTEQLRRLRESYANKQKTVTALEQAALTQSQQFKSLQQEFDGLDEKYRKLIRPARNAAGKVVVEVSYLKANGSPSYWLKEPNLDSKQYSKTELYRHLDALKNQHGTQLYTRIKIPDNSAVSHSEAWAFTSAILQKYDYYANDATTNNTDNTPKQ